MKRLRKQRPWAMNQRQKIQGQRKWIEEHGGDLAGYLERYGEDKGEAIYRADMAQLKKAIESI